MINPKTNLIAGSSADRAIEILKEEASPKVHIEVNQKNRCTAKANKNVLDDWGDTCEGHRCVREEGHAGNHTASDGANGWVSFSELGKLREEMTQVATKLNAISVAKSERVNLRGSGIELAIISTAWLSFLCYMYALSN